MKPVLAVLLGIAGAVLGFTGQGTLATIAIIAGFFVLCIEYKKVS